MAATPGSQVGHYELLARLGEGGMGEVWKARDTRLDRIVALKFSKAQFSERFHREVKAIAALNHPNIATLFDTGPDYLVMEYVEGSPVRPLPDDPRKLFDQAAQIADGLAAAHAAGFVHRDLKPDNILVTREGRVKILDFGLAKQTAPAPDETTMTMTQPGMIVGTMAYMSPEQASGKEVDARSDQFSLGLILYEMATGGRAFHRNTAPELLTAIIRDDPAPLPDKLPAPLRWIIERCLQKDPRERYDSTRDLYHDLRAAAQRNSIVNAHAAAPPPTRSGWMPWAAAAAALAVLASAATWLWTATRNGQSKQPALEYTPFAAESPNEHSAAWSPDGRSIAYVADVDGVDQVFTRTLEGSPPAQITNGKTAAARPFWSPDARRIWFEQDGGIWFIGATGGAAQRVIEKGTFATLSADGQTLAFQRREGATSTLWLARADGSDLKAYAHPAFPTDRRLVTPRFLPGSRQLAVVAFGRGAGDDRDSWELWNVPLEGGEPRAVHLEDWSGLVAGVPAWFPGGKRFLFATRVRMAAPRRLFRGEGETGVMVPVTAGPLEEREPAISPDGRRVAVTVEDARRELHEVRLDTGQARALVAGGIADFAGVWSPDGQGFAYLSEQSGEPRIWFQSESGLRRAIAGAEGRNVTAIQFSPDGRTLALDSYSKKHRTLLLPAGGGVPIEIDSANTDSHGADFSPDGAWTVYTRLASGGGAVTKIPTSGGAPVELVVAGQGPGFPARWSPAGDWIAYMPRDTIHLVSPDGKQQRKLSAMYPTWSFDSKGERIIGLRRDADRRWALWATDIRTDVEHRLAVVDIPKEWETHRIHPHPDGKRAMITVQIRSSDIWLIDGIQEH